MTRVLVSGGTGFVGRFIVEHLLERGYKVTVGGRAVAPPGFFSRPVDFTPLRLDPDIDQIAAFENIYYFVHAAFEHVPGRYRGGEGDDPAGFRRANLDGSVRLFEAARDAGVRRAIFLSSRAVYGSPPAGTTLTEDMLPRPDTLYGQVKLDTERSLQALCGHSFVTASLRATGVYGPAGAGGQHKWQPLFEEYLAGKPVAPRVATEVHGTDLARAVSLLLESDPIRINGEVFNLSDLVLDRRVILEPLKSRSGSPFALPDAGDRGALCPMSAAKIEGLGWAPGGNRLFEATISTLVSEMLAAGTP
jgi:nucleoside-diphosphate-sugar epimerase